MGKEARLWAKEHRDGNKWNVWQAILVVGLITGAASGVINGIFPSTEQNPNMIGSILSLVVELATFIAAGCCTRYLADLGAEVIKT